MLTHKQRGDRAHSFNVQSVVAMVNISVKKWTHNVTQIKHISVRFRFSAEPGMKPRIYKADLADTDLRSQIAIESPEQFEFWHLTLQHKTGHLTQRVDARIRPARAVHHHPPSIQSRQNLL